MPSFRETSTSFPKINADERLKNGCTMVCKEMKQLGVDLWKYQDDWIWGHKIQGC